jgi:hypothetical protein
MTPEGEDRRKPLGKIKEVKLPQPDLPPVVMDGQPLGDIGQEYVLFKGPLIQKHRRKDDPKPPDPHEIS